ncbi:MAG TPA: carboxypeptidase-like regulatory domain-containing protein [Planctomycetota bacterium]|nr:carboxypeptidase-like regulatory domain-containing protein [Planctomycetota bacterium]
MTDEAELEGNRFFFALAENGEIHSVSLDAWTDTGLRGAFEFEGDEIPQDLDLGQLALGAGGVARLVVLDPERRPVNGARVRARDVEGIAEETDSEGRATLQGLPPDATFEVLARGFEPIRFPAPISLEPVEVVLQRANRLTIRILDSNGAPQPAARLRISAEGVLFPEGVFNRFLTPQIPGLGSLGGRDGELHYYRLVADERGSVELQSILPGRTFALDVEDEAGGSAHHEVVEPMEAQEQRELTVRLSRPSRSLAGRVQDLFGQPLEGAAVTLLGERDGIGRKTEPDGRFLFEGLYGEEFEMKVELRGYVSSRLREVRVPPDAVPLQVVLEQGRDVRVSVVDARGKRIDAGSVFAFLSDGDQPWFAKPQADGPRLLSDVPFLDLRVRLQLDGKEFWQTLPAHVDEIVIPVPEFGRLEVAFEPDPGLPRERLGLLLRSIDEARQRWVHLIPTRTAPMEFEAVLPGSYDLSFSIWEERGSEAKFVSLRPPMRVQVAPGETTRVQLR